MPTMPERMAVVETEVRATRRDISGVRGETSEIKGDVKTLLRWMNEERGARRQRAALWSVAMVVVPILATAVMKVVFG